MGYNRQPASLAQFNVRALLFMCLFWQLKYLMKEWEILEANFWGYKKVRKSYLTTPNMICPVVSPFLTGCWSCPVA